MVTEGTFNTLTRQEVNQSALPLTELYRKNAGFYMCGLYTFDNQWQSIMFSEVTSYLVTWSYKLVQDEMLMITKINAINPQGTFMVIHPTHVRDFTKNKDVNVVMVLEVKSGDHQHQKQSSSVDHEYFLK